MSGSALVVGGGLAGLLSARRLSRAGWEVTLAEATSVLGGAVSSRFLEVPSAGDSGTSEAQVLELDGGAESYAVRGAAVRALLEELGLSGKVVAPEPLGSWLHGPAGTVPAPRLGLVAGVGAEDSGDEGLESVGFDQHGGLEGVGHVSPRERGPRRARSGACGRGPPPRASAARARRGRTGRAAP